MCNGLPTGKQDFGVFQSLRSAKVKADSNWYTNLFAWYRTGLFKETKTAGGLFRWIWLLHANTNQIHDPRSYCLLKAKDGSWFINKSEPRPKLPPTGGEMPPSSSRGIVTITLKSLKRQSDSSTTQYVRLGTAGPTWTLKAVQNVHFIRNTTDNWYFRQSGADAIRYRYRSSFETAQCGKATRASCGKADRASDC